MRRKMLCMNAMRRLRAFEELTAREEKTFVAFTWESWRAGVVTYRTVDAVWSHNSCLATSPNMRTGEWELI